jgi:hypothetical protein
LIAPQSKVEQNPNKHAQRDEPGNYGPPAIYQIEAGSGYNARLRPTANPDFSPIERENANHVILPRTPIQEPEQPDPSYHQITPLGSRHDAQANQA